MEERINHVLDAEALARAAQSIARHPVVAVDTESNSMYVYREQVCYLQIAAGDEIHLIDTVAIRDMGPLAAIFNDPKVVKVLHGADYDVVCLRRDFGLHFQNIFDTMITSQFLDKEALGLAALCREYYGVELDKSLTKYDWGKRPLEEKYVKYLAEDVLYLHGIRQHLLAAVQEADLEEELSIEFDRVANLKWNNRSFDPEGFRKIKGWRDLSKHQAEVLKAVFICREEISEEENLPPFKVANSHALLDLARVRSVSADEIGRRRAFRTKVWKRYADKIVAAVEMAFRGEISLAAQPKRDRPTRDTMNCLDELKKERKKAAEGRGVPPIVVLPNHTLAQIIDSQPRNQEELKSIPGVGEKRSKLFGDVVLKTLRKYFPS